ncbi:hypothetical protein H6F89_23835 [Cyanobacteria bacterium FACHB-63]|nr:hypothetical protein [Cyanobacteria bacterium FACHB-63]
MPGYVLHQGAVTTCSHGGLANPILTNPRVTVMGQAIALLCPYTISACTNPPPPTGLGVCITAVWTLGATRVTAMGIPVLLSTNSAVCTPTGTPLQIQFTQTRVQAV